MQNPFPSKSLLPWCRILTLKREVGKRKIKKPESILWRPTFSDKIFKPPANPVVLIWTTVLVVNLKVGKLKLHFLENAVIMLYNKFQNIG